ncbi:MAG: GNAT family N-acetyltransferase [Alphaproteobacteria bacterium]|jgi:ribosomal-protein-alanine N-acetyltransferase|nr:GNAT family N-acetyltransferase [Alphaproteobacteria bacterium]
MRRVDGARLYLRPPELKDHGEWARLRSASRAFLTPWEPTWAEDELTRAAFRFRLRRYAEDIREGRAYPFLSFRREDDALVGGITVSRIQRGVAQMCAIGYWVGEPFQSQGYTTDAVAAVVRYCFEDLGLHRVEAACQPHNAASRRVLAKVGFAEEGLARRYLKIDGDWRDHVLYGMIDPRDAGDGGA